MGAANSCSYSDIAIEKIDHIVIASKSTSFTELHFFGRYRDDCFALWTGSLQRLNEFLQSLNSINSGIQFTIEIGNESLCFLDLKITLNNGNLSTTVFSKPTDSHLYLHGDSCHPKSTKNAISIGVATRLKRICSSDEEFQVKSKEYKAYLAARDHDPTVIKKSFNTIANKSREDLRKKKVVELPTSRPVIFTTQFNPIGPDIRKIINSHLHLFNSSPVLKEISPKGSIFTAYKRLPNLKELMVRADPYISNHGNNIVDDPGYKTCNRKCDSCNNFVDSVSSFKCNATGKIFKIRKSITCSTDNVIYLCYCMKCKKQGVGSTMKWKPRLANYKSHVKNNVKSCSIVKHFQETCRDDSDPFKYMRFIILDYVDNIHLISNDELENILLEKEKFWIGSTCAIHKGLNDYHDWRRIRRNQKHKIKDW